MDAEMSTKQAKAYGEIEHGMVTRLEDGSVVLATNNLTQNLRLIQFSSSYAEVDGEGHVLLTEPSNKLDVLDEIIDRSTKPIVVCAESRQLIMLAVARLEKRKQRIPYSLIVGGMTDDQREVAMTDFQGGRSRIMLFTIKAGGVSITLTAADTIVFLQRSWSMLENKQAEDRVHREGSQIHDSIHVIDIVTPNTVEETQIARLYEKMARLEEITRHKQTLWAAGMHQQVEQLAAEEQIILGSDLSQGWTQLPQEALT
jgi:SNF2 family DNA or RNA helicase